MRPLWRGILESPWLDVHGSNIERLEHRWCLGVEVYLEHSDAIELIRYEDFMGDKSGAIADLAARLGLEERGSIEN